MKGFSMLRSAIAAALCLTALTGCKSEIALTLFTSDVFSVATTGDPLSASAIVSIEASTEEKCAELKDSIAKAMEAGFSKVEFVSCRKGSLDTWADFRVAFPLTQPKTDSDSALMIWAGDFGGRIGVTLRQNPAKVDAIIQAMPDDLRGRATGKIDAQISLVLQNDMQTTATVISQGVFMDGEPFQLPNEVQLERRAEVNITLSNVGNAAIHNGGSLLFFLKTP